MKKLIMIYGLLTILFLLSECSSSYNDSSHYKFSIQNFENPTPRGQADVYSIFLAKEKSNYQRFATFKIDTVYSYGPSTKPIGIGANLKIKIPDKFLNEFLPNENQTEFSKEFKMRIKYLYLQIPGKSDGYWEIVKIFNKNIIGDKK